MKLMLVGLPSTRCSSMLEVGHMRYGPTTTVLAKRMLK